MKRIVCLLIAVICILGFKNIEKNENVESRLRTFMEMAESRGFVVTKQYVRVVRQLDTKTLPRVNSKKDFNKFLQKNNVTSSVRIDENEHAYTAVTKEGDTFILSKNGTSFLHNFLYIMQGASENYDNLNKAILKHNYFEKTVRNTQIFSCIESEYNGKMEKDLSYEVSELMKAHSLQFVEQMNEGTFVTVSAYNKLWMDEITVLERKINVQIALKQTRTATHLTIGSPILTIDY
ncbi:MAG: YwmB family TATA-box binding protein [Bacilli bacterium]